MTSRSAEWRSTDPRTGQSVPYTPADSALIEKSYQENRQGQYPIYLGGNLFTIHFASMTQTNTSGGRRKVSRHIKVEAPKGSVNEQIAAIIGSISAETIKEAVVAIESTEGMCSFITDNLQMFKHDFLSKEASADAVTIADVVSSSDIKKESIVAILTAVIQLLCVGTLSCSEVDCAQPGALDGFSDLVSLEVNQPVPAYFANVRGEGIFRRKFLSLLGLRNLAVHGPTIFGELFSTLFSSDPSLYDGTGVDKMKYLTGNVVDLDTVVLNCSAQLHSVNELQISAGKQPFANPATFFNDPEAHKMVTHQAEHAIQDFINAFGLDEATVKARRIDLGKSSSSSQDGSSSSTIPTATNNAERGRWPVWGYANVGVYTYHANVPHLPDVVGALLRSPYQLAKAFLMCLSAANVIPHSPQATTRLDLSEGNMADLIKHLTAFFDRAVNDSCFNAKWKAIESFIDEVTRIDNIETVIGRLQEEHQDVFTAKLFDTDDANRTAEAAALVRLISNNGVKARDPQSGTIRLLCKQDVELWIKKTTV